VDPVRICFVCLGNICRSPTAEGVMARLVAEAGLTDRIELDSAGTAGWHTGRSPDRRAVAAAARRGIDLATLRARALHPGDLDWFDLVVVMDATNLVDVRDLAGDPARRDRVRLLRSFDPARAGVDEAAALAGALDVPDPYAGGEEGFDDVLDMVEAACRGLLATLAGTGVAGHDGGGLG
jgi:protein-tyrosine phosphatase